MGALLLALCLASPPCGSQESTHAQAMEFFNAGDYARAWSLLEQEPDEFWKASGRSFVLFGAGDFGQTIRFAEKGLALRGEDLNLLFRASWAAVSLGDLARAERFVGQLAAAVGSNSFTEENAVFWEQTLAQLEPRVAQLQASQEDRTSTLGRARWVSLVGLFGVLLTIHFVGRK